MCMYVCMSDNSFLVSAWVNCSSDQDLRGSGDGCGEEDHVTSHGSCQHREDLGDRQSHQCVWPVERLIKLVTCTVEPPNKDQQPFCSL